LEAGNNIAHFVRTTPVRCVRLHCARTTREKSISAGLTIWDVSLASRVELWRR
jgi:hypothetical protein